MRYFYNEAVYRLLRSLTLHQSVLQLNSLNATIFTYTDLLHRLQACRPNNRHSQEQKNCVEIAIHEVK